MKKQIIFLSILFLFLGCQTLESYRQANGSMRPTIETHSHIIVDPNYYLSNPINRFDIVVVQDPGNRDKKYIKRIIGLGGETIKITGGQIYINGKILIENFKTIPPKREFEIFIIPYDDYFLLGDNRPASFDSRYWDKKTVDKSFIHGKVIYSSSGNTRVFEHADNYRPSVHGKYIIEGGDLDVEWYHTYRSQMTLQECNKAIIQNPNDSDAYYNRAMVWSERKQFKKALIDISKSIELNDKDSVYFSDRAVIYYILGDYNNALDDLNKAVDFNPKSASVYNNRGSLKGFLGDYENALYDYNMSIQLDPKDEEVYYNRALVHEQLGNINEAIKDYNKFLKIYKANDTKSKEVRETVRLLKYILNSDQDS
jgi:signal peptidase I